MNFQQLDDQDIIDYIFGSNLSVVEIAKELCLPEVDVRRRIKDLGLGWVRRSRGGASRGQASLMRMMQQLLPGEEVVAEHPIGGRLRLDIYCPKYRLAAEYHGRQHFEFVEFFHGDDEGFEASQERDNKKLEICKEQGIALVVFRYNDELNENAVFARLLHAIKSTPYIEEEKVSRFKGNPYYESYNQRQREYRKQAYRKMKGTRGKHC